MGKHLNRHLRKEDIDMENKHIKRFSLSVINESQIETTMKHHYAPIKIAKSKILTAPNTSECAETVALIHCYK